jgi:hypothetical protein
MLNAVFTAALLMMQATPTATSAPAAAPSATPPGTVSPVTVQGRKQADEKRVICRKEVVLGTLFPREVCATKSEFAERTRVDQQELRNDTALRPYDISKGLPQ